MLPLLPSRFEIRPQLAKWRFLASWEVGWHIGPDLYRTNRGSVRGGDLPETLELMALGFYWIDPGEERQRRYITDI